MTRRPAMRSRPGWSRLSLPGDKLGACWLHDASGWVVKHCGHPTANWPYYLIDPACPHRGTVTHNGKGFRTLLEACEAVEDVLAGRAYATNEGCGAETRRLMRGAP